MAKISLEEFYETWVRMPQPNGGRSSGNFNVFRLEDCYRAGAAPIKYNRRDFYKISLIRGHYIYHYADKSIEIDGNTLIFFNPNIPYTFEEVGHKERSGFFCIFKDSFLVENTRLNVNELPMFNSAAKPAYILTDIQSEQVGHLFLKIMDEINSDYVFKYDLIGNYVSGVIHYALKITPSENLYSKVDANSRIASVFMELLERQFPIESSSQTVLLRSANDFAENLAIHVNHLNRAVRLSTGKTTTEIIAERITAEARALLQHTNWNVAEISYSLGFKEPANFNNFFKKQTDITPTAYRNVSILQSSV